MLVSKTDSAKGLSKKIRKVVKATGHSRDLDTLVIRAKNVLSKRQFKVFEAALGGQKKAAHEDVVRLLRSGKWEAVSRTLASLTLDTLAGDLTQNESHTQAKERLRLRIRLAMEENSDASWHKLRIAAKKIRYALEYSNRQHHQDIELQTFCKELQRFLGEWHDAVVHHNLLCRLEQNLDQKVSFGEPEHALFSSALENLIKDCEEVEVAALEEVRRLLVKRKALCPS